MSFKTNFAVSQLLNTIDLEGIPEKDVKNFYIKEGKLTIITDKKEITKDIWKNGTGFLAQAGLGRSMTSFQRRILTKLGESSKDSEEKEKK